MPCAVDLHLAVDAEPVATVGDADAQLLARHARGQREALVGLGPLDHHRVAEALQGGEEIERRLLVQEGGRVCLAGAGATGWEARGDGGGARRLAGEIAARVDPAAVQHVEHGVGPLAGPEHRAALDGAHQDLDLYLARVVRREAHHRAGVPVHGLARERLGQGEIHAPLQRGEAAEEVVVALGREAGRVLLERDEERHRPLVDGTQEGGAGDRVDVDDHPAIRGLVARDRELPQLPRVVAAGADQERHQDPRFGGRELHPEPLASDAGGGPRLALQEHPRVPDERLEDVDGAALGAAPVRPGGVVAPQGQRAVDASVVRIGEQAAPGRELVLACPATLGPAAALEALLDQRLDVHRRAAAHHPPGEPRVVRRCRRFAARELVAERTEEALPHGHRQDGGELGAVTGRITHEVDGGVDGVERMGAGLGSTREAIARGAERLLLDGDDHADRRETEPRVGALAVDEAERSLLHPGWLRVVGANRAGLHAGGEVGARRFEPAQESFQARVRGIPSALPERRAPREHRRAHAGDREQVLAGGVRQGLGAPPATAHLPHGRALRSRCGRGERVRHGAPGAGVACEEGLVAVQEGSEHRNRVGEPVSHSVVCGPAAHLIQRGRHRRDRGGPEVVPDRGVPNHERRCEGIGPEVVAFFLLLLLLLVIVIVIAEVVGAELRMEVLARGGGAGR